MNRKYKHSYVLFDDFSLCFSNCHFLFISLSALISVFLNIKTHVRSC